MWTNPHICLPQSGERWHMCLISCKCLKIIRRLPEGTHNQDVDAEAFSHALPDQLVPDLTLPQEPLHPRGFLCAVPSTSCFQICNRLIKWIQPCQHWTFWLTEQGLPFNTGTMSYGWYVTGFMAWLRWWCACTHERRVVHFVGHPWTSTTTCMAKTLHRAQPASFTQAWYWLAGISPAWSCPWLFLSFDWFPPWCISSLLLHVNRMMSVLQRMNANRIWPSKRKTIFIWLEW